jgi:hypothetical protein
MLPGLFYIFLLLVLSVLTFYCFSLLLTLCFFFRRIVLRGATDHSKEGGDHHSGTLPSSSADPLGSALSASSSSSTFSAMGWPADTNFHETPPVQQPGSASHSDDPAAKFTRYPTLGSPTNAGMTAPFFFNIGTVDSFERKLEEAQRSLGIAPRDFIPVIYVNETPWTTEVMR